MSPPVISPHSTFEISKPDFCNTNSFESSKSFGFSLDSTCTAGFDYSKTASEKSHISTRSRPRLMKMRKRQMPTSQDGKTVKSDIGLNGLSGVSGEKADNLGNAVGVDNRNLGSSASGASADFNRNMEELGSGLGFSVGVSGSSVGLGSEYGKPLFDSSTNSSTSKPQCDFSFTFNKGNSNFDVQKENGSFVFGARKDSPTINQNLPGAFPDHGSINNGLKMDANLASGHLNFGVDKSNFNEKVSRGNPEFQKSDAQFVFGSDSYDSGSRVKLCQQDFIKSGLGLSADEPAKVNDANFVFGARKDVSGTIGSGIVDKSECDRVSGNTIPDVRGKVKLDTSGDSEKVRDSCFQFPYSSSDSSYENHVNFVFASGKRDSKVSVELENKSTDRDAENGFQSQNACLNGVLVFGGLKGKGGLNPNGSTEPFAELNKGKTEDCDGFGQNSHNLCSEFNPKFHISGSSVNSFGKDSAFSVSDAMKRLNIGGSEVDDKKSGSFIGNFAVNTNNVFVFGGDGKNIDSTKENLPALSQNTPKVNRSSHNNFGDRSSFFPSSGIGVDQIGEVLSMNDGDKDSISFKSKLAGLDSSNSDFSTPNVKFEFSNNNLFPGIDKLDKTNLRSMGGKKSKKHGKLKQRTVVQRLFSQNHVSEEGNFQKNQESPNYGSPMDFSPYQNTSANNAPVVDTTTEVKENLSTNGEHTLEQCEKSCDDMSSSEFSFSLAAQDGRPALKTQLKKKYKLKVGSNPTVQKKGPVKENAKQEPSGTAIHEACEHWRIRGNDAYHAGQLSKAEELYSMGINSAPRVNTIGYSMKPLLLCYSNRAATRMSLGRMRDAIGDCIKASELDSDFLKATLRAGNCYLVLGEVEDAIKCYTKCLSNATSICLDRRVTIEAADGLHKAKKVAEHMLLSSNLLQEGTDDAASSALEIIEEALLISRFSEGLLEMKGEVLFMMRMYDKVIQFCDQTLDIAENNLGTDLLDNPKCKSSHVKLWRWHLQTKSLYRLGKLDSALDLIGKLENLPFSSKSGDKTWESVIALAANIRELLSLKKSGNEAFSSGRYNEAIENYTSAISKSFESRGFMAICFCNRAAAFQSLKQISDAISDCSVAIALDENYLKAISRRATLHEMIRDYKQAVIDLQKLASLLESQSQTKTQARSSGGSVRDLRKTRRRLSLAEEKAKKENSLDLYLILGIKASDSESEIKKAYRKAALRHHPDKAGQVLSRNDVADDGTFWKEFGEKIYGDADRMFKIIGEAYAVLSDPSKRSKYDDEEEMKKIYRDNNRSNNTDHPSTSYKSPFGRQGGFSSSFERNGGSSSRRHWYDARSYSYSHSHW